MSDISFELPPEDCDLRDYQFMPLDVLRLRDSAVVDAVSAEEFRAAVLLWCAAWHQVPAASLPNDDAQLAKFAGYGRVVSEWEKVRTGALYGFEVGPDGRLYHPVIAEKAIEAWSGKRSASRRGKAGAEKRWGTKNGKSNASANASANASTNGSATENNGASILENAPATPVNGSAINLAIENHSKGEGQGKDRERTDSVEDKSSTGANGADLLESRPAWWPVRDRYGRVTTEITEKIMFDVGKAVLGNSSGGQIARMRKAYGGDMRAVVDFLLQADEKSTPSEWFAGVLKRAERNDNPAFPKHEIYPKETHH